MTDWPAYLRAYHGAAAGITEQLLLSCTEDPYDWLVAGIPAGSRRLLDLACGSAPTYRRLAPGHYVGVDASAEELRAASAHGAHPLVRGAAERLPLRDSSVDVVVVSMALQVLTPLSGVLAELARVLRADGRLVAMVPAHAPLTLSDRLRYGQLLWELRRTRLGQANGALPRQLLRAGWRITSQQSRRFAYRIPDAAAAGRLVDAFYLPGTSAQRKTAAQQRAGRWAGRAIGIPLLRLTATPPAGSA